MVAPPFIPIPPEGYGGIERVVALLVEGLARRGHAITLFAAPGSSASARLVIPLTSAALLGDPSSVHEEAFHVTTAYLRADEFDVIHDHTWLGPMLGAQVSHRVPVVHTLHGPWTPLARRLYGLIHDRVRLVAISRTQRFDNPDLSYAGIVYNGIDLAEYPFREVKEPYLVFMGRVSPEKRPEVAIDIARRAGLPLVMMVKRSEPFEQEYWDQVVAPVLGPDIEVLDQPPQDVKVDILGRARAMLFPIDWSEPFGIVMLESMACGTPVIARPLGAAPEVVLDQVTGALCSTSQEMVDAVATIDSIRPIDCRSRVQRKFSAEAMVSGYERIYRRAATATERRREKATIARLPQRPSTLDPLAKGHNGPLPSASASSSGTSTSTH